MRDLIIVTVLCMIAALLVDHFWLNGKYLKSLRHELGVNVSSIHQ